MNTFNGVLIGIGYIICIGKTYQIIDDHVTANRVRHRIRIWNKELNRRVNNFKISRDITDKNLEVYVDENK